MERPVSPDAMGGSWRAQYHWEGHGAGYSPLRRSGHANSDDAHRTEGDPSDVRACDEEIKRHPRDPNMYINRGNGWLLRRDFERALSDFQFALSLDQDYWRSNAVIGILYQRTNQLDLALKYLGRSIELNAQNSPAYQARALVHLANKEFSAALMDANSGINVAGNTSNLHFALNIRGVILERMGRIEEAIKDFSSAVKANPNNREAASNLKRLESLTNLKSFLFDQVDWLYKWGKSTVALQHEVENINKRYSERIAQVETAILKSNDQKRNEIAKLKDEQRRHPSVVALSLVLSINLIKPASSLGWSEGNSNELSWVTFKSEALVRERFKKPEMGSFEGGNRYNFVVSEDQIGSGANHLVQKTEVVRNGFTLERVSCYALEHLKFVELPKAILDTGHFEAFRTARFIEKQRALSYFGRKYIESPLMNVWVFQGSLTNDKILDLIKSTCSE